VTEPLGGLRSPPKKFQTTNARGLKQHACSFSWRRTGPRDQGEL
jgi:hypothetical protein